MNPRIAVVAVAFGLAASFCQADNSVFVLERAKRVVNQADDRQGIPQQYPGSGTPGAPGAPGAAGTPPAPVAPTLTPAQQALMNLNTDLAAIHGDAKPEQVAALADGLQANAHLGGRPSTTAIKKLSVDLAAAMANKTLPVAQRGRVEQDLVAIFNDTSMPLAQYNDVVADVPTVLKRAGVDAKLTTAVADDLKAIALEVRKKL